MLLSRVGLRNAAGLAGFTLALVAAAYQWQRPVVVPMDSALAGLLVEDFHDAEEGYRWSRARSCLRIPDLGAGVTGRVEITWSGFRPPGEPLPIAMVSVGDHRQRLEAPRRVDRFSVPVTTTGVGRSDLDVCFRSQTFSPGAGDRRALGVRVHDVRFVPDRKLSASVPPLRQLLMAMGIVVLGYGVFASAALRRAVVLALVSGAGYALFRPYTCLLALPILLLLLLAFLMVRLFPSVSSAGRAYGRAWIRSAGEATAGLASFGTPALLLLSLLAVSISQLARETFVIDLGTGREAGRVRRFASFDAAEGVTFRRAMRGASVDLRDFGSGSPWRIAITAAVSGGEERQLPLARAAGVDHDALLGGDWRVTRFEAEPGGGWRSGLVLDFHGATDAVGLIVDRIEVAHGRTWPAPRVLAYTTATALLLLLASLACGLPGPVATGAAAAIALGQSVALWLEPVLAVSFVPVFGLISLLGATLAISLRALARAAVTPAVLALCVLGFIVWLSGMSFPLYHGLHFLYHSNIAEEIWKGKFLTFYLPNPENILMTEAQWGGLIVPYPCLYHTSVAPLAALPAPAFGFLQKVLQAAMLAGMAMMAALLARRFGGDRAAAWAALATISLSATFQLLTLAHFITVFGCFAATMALGYLILNFERLGGRAFWWAGVLLLTFAFLSYTASLLFTACTLALALPWLWRENPERARSLLTCSVTALAAAFFLYYVHWVLPFIRESLPILFAREESGSLPLWARLASQPRKFTYSFGSTVIPLAGLFGLTWATRRSRLPSRRLLLAWSAILVVFSGFDLLFNFILKHHYFVMVPVSLGVGLLAAKLMESRGFFRAVAVTLLAVVVFLGARSALALAMGTMQ